MKFLNLVLLAALLQHCLSSSGVSRVTPLSGGTFLMHYQQSQVPALVTGDKAINWQTQALHKITRQQMIITDSQALGSDTLVFFTQARGVIIATYQVDSTDWPETVNIDFTAEPMKVLRLYSFEKKPGQLLNNQVYHVFRQKDIIYFTYNHAEGLGVTACELQPGQACRHLTKKNSFLKSNSVKEVASDLTGNLWFIYDETEEAGVTRKDINQSVQHFDQHNSSLASSAVLDVIVEPENSGLPGNNLWFITSRGLNRFEYSSDGTEKWHLYGRKENLADSLARVVGIDSWFKEAVTGIRQVEILKDSVLLVNDLAIFQLTPDSINQFSPEEIGGLDKNRIDYAHVHYNQVLVSLSAEIHGHPAITYLLVFDLFGKKWHRLNISSVSNTHPASIEIVSISSEQCAIIFNFRNQQSQPWSYNARTFRLTQPVEMKKVATN